MERRDKHHLLWTEKHWTSTPEAQSLRTQPSLIFRLDRLTHERIHKETPPVPLLGYYALRGVNNLYTPSDIPSRSLDNLMSAIEKSANHPKAHLIEKHLAELAIWAIDEQKPLIVQNSPDQPRGTVIDLGSYRQSNREGRYPEPTLF